MSVPDGGFVTSRQTLLFKLPVALWLAWIIYWLRAARSAAGTRRSESWQSGVSYRIPLCLGIVLLSLRRLLPPPWSHLLYRAPIQSAIAAVALQGAGLGLTVWARIHLGKYWSATITLKQGHQVIQTGPYARVRHPIYSGLLLALVGTVIWIGTLQSFLGAGLLFGSFIRKLTLEERWLREHLGDEYGRYQQRVKALIPGLI
ncbi:MAG: isoprenylcysteine carboxylmethyltransferase family protein [Verrucomicrobia bacterium]|nr:isoprenylcysteine carboxylmethyltransferase family protein [Verrucomicrobiota bacterium]